MVQLIEADKARGRERQWESGEPLILAERGQGLFIGFGSDPDALKADPKEGTNKGANLKLKGLANVSLYTIFGEF